MNEFYKRARPSLRLSILAVLLVALVVSPLALVKANEAENAPVQGNENSAPVNGPINGPGNNNAAPIQNNDVNAPSQNGLISAPVGGSGLQSARGTGSALAAELGLASRNSEEPQATPLPPVYHCSISPVYKKLAIAQEAEFRVTCDKEENGAHGTIPCPPQISWESDAGTVRNNVVEPTIVYLTAGSQTTLNGKLTASMELGGQAVSCRSNIEVYTEAEGCLLDPREATLAQGEQKTFTATCFTTKPIAQDGIPPYWNAREVPCPEFTLWQSDAGSVSGSGRTGTLTAANVGSGKYVEARYVARSIIPEDQFYCRSSVTVNAAPAQTPTPTPGGGGSGGSGGGSNVLVPYTGYNYVDKRASATPTPSAPPAPSPSPSPRPTMGKLVLYPVTPSPSPTAAALAAPSGITGLFTAQAAPLALGLLLGIIAVVLLWYWLAGGKEGGKE